jgi:hypothetical protein
MKWTLREKSEDFRFVFISEAMNRQRALAGGYRRYGRRRHLF